MLYLFWIYDIILLLPSLEGDMEICPPPPPASPPPKKNHVTRGRHEFSGRGGGKSSCLLTNWAINCLLYRKLNHDVLQRRALCRDTWQGNTTARGRHDDLPFLHVTSLDQSYFFIRHINFMRHNKFHYYNAFGINRNFQAIRRLQDKRRKWLTFAKVWEKSKAQSIHFHLFVNGRGLFPMYLVSNQ